MIYFFESRGEYLIEKINSESQCQSQFDFQMIAFAAKLMNEFN